MLPLYFSVGISGEETWQANTECRLVMDRDENSAVNIYQRFLARLGPHMDDSVRCTDVFTAIDNANTCKHI